MRFFLRGPLPLRVRIGRVRSEFNGVSTPRFVSTAPLIVSRIEGDKGFGNQNISTDLRPKHEREIRRIV